MQHPYHPFFQHVQRVMYVLTLTLVLWGIVSTPLVTHATAADTTWLTNLAGESTELLDAVVLALIVGAFLLFVWGMVVFISQTGNDASRESGRSKMVWGLLGLFVLVAVWGIVAILKTMVGVPDATFVAPTATFNSQVTTTAPD